MPSHFESTMLCLNLYLWDSIFPTVRRDMSEPSGGYVPGNYISSASNQHINLAALVSRVHRDITSQNIHRSSLALLGRVHHHISAGIVGHLSLELTHLRWAPKTSPLCHTSHFLSRQHRSHKDHLPSRCLQNSKTPSHSFVTSVEALQRHGG
jgi:hypothetical protein